MLQVEETEVLRVLQVTVMLQESAVKFFEATVSTGGSTLSGNTHKHYGSVTHKVAMFFLISFP